MIAAMPHYCALDDQKIGTFQRSRKAKKLNSLSLLKTWSALIHWLFWTP